MASRDNGAAALLSMRASSAVATSSNVAAASLNVVSRRCKSAGDAPSRRNNDQIITRGSRPVTRRNQGAAGAYDASTQARACASSPNSAA
jgi:hypothetical protein